MDVRKGIETHEDKTRKAGLAIGVAITALTEALQLRGDILAESNTESVQQWVDRSMELDDMITDLEKMREGLK